MRKFYNTIPLAIDGAGGAVLPGRFRIALVVATCAAALLPFTADAQRSSGSRIRTTTLQVDDGASPSVPLPRNPTGFRLFAAEDLAASGMKMTGNLGWQFPNVGPCPFYYFFSGSNGEACGLMLGTSQGGVAESYFEIGFIAGAPISEARKIRAVHPGINNMTPPFGYTSPYTSYLVPPRVERWGPGDGQFGRLFSGVQTVNDGSCRDHSSALSGRWGGDRALTLLAGSDCPPTWPSTGFDGKRVLVTDSLVALFRANPATFRFDDFRFPRSAFDTTQVLGNFATYGNISDSYRELIQRYGGVTRLGSGNPTERGYPLGLDIRFDAFQFARPSIRNAVFYQLTMVNNSARLYGSGIDYDSLYFGMMPGFLLNGPQSGSWYFDFTRNAIIVVGGNVSKRCSGTFPRRTSVSGGCINFTEFDNSGQGFVILKSPIGDTRNKLFSDPASPFFNPGSPLADDTITYNHAGRAGFGFLYNSTVLRSDRAFFGYMASKEVEFIDDRNVNAFTALQTLQLFQSEEFRNFTGTVTPEMQRFNRFVPGSTTIPTGPGAGQPYGKWDYNNDGIQDTIYVPGCGRNGCHTVFSDTMASGLNNIVSNIGNIFSTGPFALKAGDTTQFIYAFIGANDSASFESLLNSTVNAYLTNYAGPGSAPPPMFTVADVDVQAATVRDSLAGDTRARVRIRLNVSAFVDPFVASIAARLQDSTDIAARRLVALNPSLLADVQAVALNNFADILVFKSCDRGQTFTVSADCSPARATDVDGTDIGLGFQPLTVIAIDSLTGQPADAFFTDFVQAGRTYLYSFVTRTRGLIDIPVIDSIGGFLRPTNLADALSIDADTIVSPLFRSGPNTVLVYAPISLPGGTLLASLDTATVLGQATQFLTAVPSGAVAPGSFRVVFANRFIVTTKLDTVRNRSTQTVIAQRILRASTTGTASDTGTANFIAAADTFSGPGPVVVSGGGVPSNRTGVLGDTVFFLDTIAVAAEDVTGFVLARSGAIGSNPAFFISLTRDDPGEEFSTSPSFPGFNLFFEDPTATRSTPRLSVTVRAEGDTLNRGVVSTNAVTFQANISSFTGPGGKYEITWSDDAFGPRSPFVYTTVPELQAQLTASLSERRNSTTGDTSAATRALVGGTRPLIPVKIPFSVVGPNGAQATLAMFRRNTTSTDSALRNSRLFGTAGDTVRLTVPADIWLPGDTLFVIEAVARDSTVNVAIGTRTVAVTFVRDTTVNGRTLRAPVQVTSPALTFPRFVLGCTSQPALIPGRNSCNPLALTTRASTGYLPYQAGFETVLDFARPFDLFSEVLLTATAQQAGNDPTTLGDRGKVRVVPNPYVVQSGFDAVDANRTGSPRILFTNVPVAGSMRIYSVAGQFIQALSWTQSDLEVNCRPLQPGGEPTACDLTGDLAYNLRTREGLEIGTGLYLYVITPKTDNGNGNGNAIRGKFVIIR
ncbi:MAG: hypothetical protein M3466_00870 [Gemmatimonadota bacterium]|nr:hypothetical protein [Gemmatimonadota bacterium]